MSFIIKYIGITQDPKTKEYMLIMNYANEGDLHYYLQKDFANITWKTKLLILWVISMGYLYFNLLIILLVIDIIITSSSLI